MFPATIKKRADFVKVNRNGARAKTRSVIGVCLMEDHYLKEPPRVGYTASKKVGNAVVRNKAKRRLRSLVLEFVDRFDPGFLFVLIATPETANVEYSILKSDFLYCVSKSRERACSDYAR